MRRNPVYVDPADHNIVMLKGMACFGLPMSLLGHILAEFRRDLNVPQAILRYVFGPLIVHVEHLAAITDNGEIGWLDRDTLNRWRPRVDVERLEILCGERPDIVSPTEIWLVVYNATMAAPLRHELTEVYLWAADRAARAAGKTSPLMPGSRKSDEYIVLDDDVLDERGRYHHTYVELCRAIIAKVVAKSSIGRRQRSQISPTHE